MNLCRIATNALIFPVDPDHRKRNILKFMFKYAETLFIYLIQMTKMTVLK